MKIFRTIINVGSVTMIMLIIREYFHIIGKYRDSAHRDCNINRKLNHRISVVFHILKNMILIL